MASMLEGVWESSNELGKFNRSVVGGLLLTIVSDSHMNVVQDEMEDFSLLEPGYSCRKRNFWL